MCINKCINESCERCMNYKAPKVPAISLYTQAKHKCDEYLKENFVPSKPCWYAPSAHSHSFAKNIIFCRKEAHNVKEAFNSQLDVDSYFESYKSALSVFMYHLNQAKDE